MKFFEDDRLLISVLILFSTAIFCIGLGTMALTDPDEVFYAQTAKEMLGKGSVLTPYIFGIPQFEKPPLFYWLVMAGYRVFGINEFSARFPSAVLGIIGVLAVYFLGKLLINRRTGFFAGLVLATSLEYLVLARACVTDMALGVFILLTFLFFFHGYQAKLKDTKWYLLTALCLGLAVLTKGPVGVLLPGLVICIYLLAAKEIKNVLKMPILQSVLVFVIVALPWYLLANKVHGKLFIDEFFGFHNVVRFLEPEHAWGDVFYYYLPIFLGGMFPWSAFLPLAIWRTRREHEPRIKRANLFFVIWFFVILIFFSISRTKLPTYIFPLFPAVALVIGRLWDVFIGKGLVERAEKMMYISIYSTLGLMIAGVIGLFIFLRGEYPEIALPAFLVGGGFIIFTACSTLFLSGGKNKEALIVFIVAFIALVIPISYIILPEIGIYESSKKISNILLTHAKEGEKIGAETQYRRGVAFYTDRVDIPDVHKHHILTAFLSRPERVWCIMKKKNHMQLYTTGKRPYTKPTYVVYQFGKKVIVTNKIPEHGEYLKVEAPYGSY